MALPRLAIGVALLALPLYSMAGSMEYCGEEAMPCMQYGAAVFQERCALCHGSDGMGEGALSLSVKDYPAANLMEPRVTYDDASLRRAIIEGPRFADINALMPPWGDELTVTQLDSVAMFVAFLRKDMEGALKIARIAAKNTEPSLKLGRALFLGHCSLCHGKEGMGDGRMAARLETKPVNLTKSRAPDSYLKTIITLGGAAVGRSHIMPTWGNDLTDPEIESVIMYVNTLRSPFAVATESRLSPKASAETGATVFANICSVCHGLEGKGDGVLAATLVPKPVNLTLSRAPNSLMKAIITDGSAAAGRSEIMPAWGEALSPVEIDSVILYINKLRPPLK